MTAWWKVSLEKLILVKRIRFVNAALSASLSDFNRVRVSVYRVQKQNGLRSRTERQKYPRQLAGDLSLSLSDICSLIPVADSITFLVV